jgi:predicted GIY-YIG superfamily endonuclease
MKKRCIYVYEFEDNSIYVGLTCNINERNKKHLRDFNSSVNEHIKICPNYKLIQKTDYIEEKIAKIKEKEILIDYKNKNYNILNKIETGSLGGCTLKWTYEKCKEEALKYDYKKDFMKKSPGAYKRSIIEKWLDEICSHMKPIYKSWSFEKCKEEALKYKYKKDFMKNSHGA